jgi:hypothetical protein
MCKKILFPFILFLFSCNNPGADNEAASADTSFIEQDSALVSNEENPMQFKNLVWVGVFDSAKQDIELKQQRLVNPDTLTATKLISEINAAWDGIKLEFRKISNDTLYVAIPKALYLHNKWEAAEHTVIIASTTFTLTELKQIKFVTYDFEEGDHLSPGTMKRSDFK